MDLGLEFKSGLGWVITLGLVIGLMGLSLDMDNGLGSDWAADLVDQIRFAGRWT